MGKAHGLSCQCKKKLLPFVQGFIWARDCDSGRFVPTKKMLARAVREIRDVESMETSRASVLKASFSLAARRASNARASKASFCRRGEFSAELKEFAEDPHATFANPEESGRMCEDLQDNQRLFPFFPLSTESDVRLYNVRANISIIFWFIGLLGDWKVNHHRFTQKKQTWLSTRAPRFCNAPLSLIIRVG